MPNIVEGLHEAAPYSFAVVVSRFNELITRRLLDGALDCLREHGADERTIEVVHCPGAFEIPLVAQALALRQQYDAIICLGCIIRGETPHFEYIANAVSTGLMRVMLETKVPLAFGILTTDSLEQAVERAGGKGNKGWDAALAAVELADLHRKLPGNGKKLNP